MRTALLVLLCVAAVFADDYTYDEGVVVLTDSNFNQALQEFDFALIEFYAPWCGHCKRLAPEYASAAQQLASDFPQVKLAKVDCTVEKDTAAKFDIKGFPTIKFFVKGNPTPLEYGGGRTAPEIVNWLKKKAGPSSIHIDNLEDAEKAISDNEVLGFFFGPVDSESHKSFAQTAAGYDDIAFAHTDNQAVKDKYQVNGDTFILFKKFDEGKNILTDAFHNLRDFINTHRFPTILNFDQKAAQRIFGEGVDSIFLIRGDDDAGARAEEAFRSVASDVKDKITLSLAKFDDSLGSRLAEYIGVTKEHLPAIRIVQPSNNNQKFIFENEISTDNIRAFVEQFKSGTLKPTFKSAPIPEESHEEGVRVLVGKNFQDIVLNQDVDALVEYYAPWCGHCKSLAPIYASLAQTLKDVPNLVIAKMDATANEVEGLSIQGFPTIKFYPKNNKQNPIDFNGDRSEQGFTDFLREQGVRVPEGGNSSAGQDQGHDHSHDGHDHSHDGHDHSHDGHDHGHNHGQQQPDTDL